MPYAFEADETNLNFEPSLSPEIQKEDFTSELENLLNLRPDAVAIHYRLKKIAILEHCRPYDGTDREHMVRPSPLLSNPAPQVVSMANDDGGLLPKEDNAISVGKPPNRSDGENELAECVCLLDRRPAR